MLVGLPVVVHEKLALVDVVELAGVLARLTVGAATVGAGAGAGAGAAPDVTVHEYVVCAYWPR